MPEGVEMRPAFAWDCPACGRGHYVNALVPDISPEDRDTLRRENGCTDAEINALLADQSKMPDRVKCTGCGGKFVPVRFGELGDAEPETPETA